MDVQFANPDLQALYDSDRRVVVVTAHRRENWGDGLRGIAEGVARLADRHPDVGFVLPVHPNPRVREVLTERLQGLENVLLTEPLGYATFARLLGRAHIVITDSGGIQEEAPSLGKPVLVTRETTERTEGLAAGTLRLVGTDPEVIFREATACSSPTAAYREMAEAENPYGDGHAAERIVACPRAPAAGDRTADPIRHRLQPRRRGARRRDALRPRDRGRGSCARRSTRRRSRSPPPTSRRELEQELRS